MKLVASTCGLFKLKKEDDEIGACGFDSVAGSSFGIRIEVDAGDGM